MLRLTIVIFSLHCLLAHGNTVKVPCPFNPSHCTCYFTEPTVLTFIQCVDVAEIPRIINRRINDIQSLEIDGNFTQINNLTFSNMSISTLAFSRVGNPLSPLDIEPEAFLSSAIQFIKFSNYSSLTSIPTNQLTRATGLSELFFTGCNFTVLANQSFNGLIGLANLYVADSHVEEVEPGALEGLENYLQQLSFRGNLLTVVPADVTNMTRLITLDLGNNQITRIPDYSLPSGLLILDLSKNPSLSDIDDQAFSKVLSLQALDLSFCNFSTVPVNVLQQQAFNALSSLNLQNNRISHLDANAFGRNFNAMYFPPNLNYNPVEYIDAQAFFGLPTVTIVQYTELYELKSVDLAIFAGMSNLYEIYFNRFPRLQIVALSDETRLPRPLSLITVQRSDSLQYIDPKFGQWLARNKGNTLNISNNTRLKCSEDLIWMMEFYFCTFHPQIVIDGSYCADYKIPLVNYLEYLKNSHNCL